VLDGYLDRSEAMSVNNRRHDTGFEYHIRWEIMKTSFLTSSSLTSPGTTARTEAGFQY